MIVSARNGDWMLEKNTQQGEVLCLLVTIVWGRALAELGGWPYVEINISCSSPLRVFDVFFTV